jgi:5'-deoxynucleotidase YfbR-like HD superfamily hydrolase
MKTQIEFMLYGSEVKRYHTLTTLREETVAHHSHNVAMLVLVLDPGAGVRLLEAALLHDLAEQVTGDIPSPAKREYGIGDQVDALEDRLLRESGWAYPALLENEKRTLKLADIASGALFCLREMDLGNVRARIVFDRYISYARGMALVGRHAELFNTIEEMANV